MEHKKISESYYVASILALVGGYLDVYTYLCKGHVFANAQTGNIVLLGIQLSEFHFKEALYYLVPVLSFFVGILVAEASRDYFKESRIVHWRQVTIVIECISLFVIAFMPSGQWDMVANTLVSFACSLQVKSFMKVSGKPFATTMCTGNLRSASEQLYRFLRKRETGSLAGSIEYFGIIGIFTLGACFGTVVTKIFGHQAVWGCCILLIIVFVLLRQERVTVPQKSKE